MHTVEIVLVLLVALAVVGAIARRTQAPLPILLAIAGVLLSFVPGMGDIRLAPEIFFVLFIPPLLFSDGWLSPKRELLAVLRPVLLLAFGLVFLTVVAIGLLMHWLIPSLPLAAAFALGAIVSPTDALATAAMAGRVGLPPRATHILKGESLINDASGLVAFKFAVAALATGAFSWSAALLDLAVLGVGGTIVGVAVAWGIGRVRRGLRHYCADDPRVQTILSVLTPFAAYLAAEALQVSGILAVVAAGLYAGWNDFRHLDATTRQHSWEVWMMLLFVFNGIVFLLLGTSLQPALAGLPGESYATLAGYALALWGAMTLVRMLWVFPAAYLPRLLVPRVREREGPLDPRGVFLVGWAGLRGSVTLAAALSIPLVANAGAPFPGRDLMIFLAATTIVLTLVINGLTLPLLVRQFGVSHDGSKLHEARAAEIAVGHAATHALEVELAKLRRPEDVALARELIAGYGARLTRFTANADRRRDENERLALRRRLALVAIAAERAELYAMRDAGVINEDAVRSIEARIDHAELYVTEAARDAE
jgi:CPA1 family monovalent cation:H+ antiporter